MDTIYDAIKSPGFGILTFAFGVLVTWLFFRLGLRDRSPRYIVAGDNLLKQKLPKLRVHYHGYGEDLEDVTVSYLCFWNDGGGTINNLDVQKADPVAIRVPEGIRIVDAIVLKKSREAIGLGCIVSQDKTRALLTFDFLDKNDGILVCLIHTGTELTAVSLTGTIRGTGPRGIRRSVYGIATMSPGDRPPIEVAYRRLHRAVKWVAIVGLLCFLLLAAYYETRIDMMAPMSQREQEIVAQAKYGGVFDTLFLGGFGVLWGAFLVRRTPRRLPRSFREYEALFAG
jgi:hypothetical protein